MTEAVIIALLVICVVAVGAVILVDMVQRRERRRADREIAETKTSSAMLRDALLDDLERERAFAGEFKRRLEERESTWLDAVTRRRLLVQTTDGQTIDGPLVRVDADGIVVGPARHADSGQSLAGEVWIPRAKVAWVQNPDTGTR